MQNKGAKSYGLTGKKRTENQPIRLREQQVNAGYHPYAHASEQRALAEATTTNAGGKKKHSQGHQQVSHRLTVGESNHLVYS